MRRKTAVSSGEVQPVSLWRNRDFVLLQSGQTISTLGSSISGLAFLFLVLALTHSPVQAGLITSVRALPFLLLALPAGAWADRWNRKTVIILCDTGRALSLTSIPVALAIGHLTVVQLYFNALIEGTLLTLFNIALTASIPRIVAQHQLTEATAVNFVTGQTVSLIGPPVGTFLYGVALAIPFLADAVSYLVSAFSMFWITSEFQQPRSSPARHLRQEIVEGISWIWKQAILRYQVIAGCGLNLVLATNVLIVTLLAKQQHAAPVAIGLIFAIGGIGGVVGSLLATRVQEWLSFGQVMIGMFWMLALLWPLYAIAPNAVVLGGITAGLFSVESIGSIVNIGYRLAITPDKFQGRVNGIHRLGNALGRLVGPVLAGVLLQYAGTTLTVLFFFGVLLVFAISTALNTPVRTAPRL
jgi:predicted MFS family arabinose efflux permease